MAQPGAPTTVIVGGTRVANTGPTISGVTASVSTAARYGLIEVRFTLGTTYANPDYPYDATDTFAANPAGVTYVEADGVTVDLIVRLPDGSRIVVPCFYQVPYAGVEESGLEVFGASGPGRWVGRFAGTQVGEYAYVVRAVDATGTSTSTGQSVTVTAGPNPGYVRASTTDSRFLQTDDGRSWWCNGAGSQWINPVANQGRRAYDIIDRLATYTTNKGNCTRFWDSSDFSLSVEGVTMPVWIAQNTTVGAAVGVLVNTGGQDQGLRSANPAQGAGWYQRVYQSDGAGVTHRLVARVKSTSGVAARCRVAVKTTAGFDSGTSLASVTNTATTAWTSLTATWTTTSDKTIGVSLVQDTGTGSDCAYDSIQIGPDNGAGGVTYNELSDGDFERHFFAGNSGNDPSATPSLARPIGTWFAPWATYEMDLIMAAAESTGMRIEMCACSGPWFIWPTNPQDWDQTTFGQAWALKYTKRSYRNRIARWGYSTSVLAWELHNEWGHINSSATPNQYTYISDMITWLGTNDPFDHLVTASQNSQAYSPQLNSALLDVGQWHWYNNGTIAALDNDEVLTVQRFFACMMAQTAPASSALCTTTPSLGLGDGSAWTGGGKPLIGGEWGIGTDMTPGAVTGNAGIRFLHNQKWACAFSSAITGCFEWWWWDEDAGATAAKLAALKGVGTFFATIDVHNGGLTFIHTANDLPGSTGTMTTSDTTNSRAYGFRRSDQTAAYVWVQNKGYSYSNTGSITATAPTITVPGLKNSTVYRVRFYNTDTGAVTSTTTATSNGSGVLSVAVASTSADAAFQAEEANWPQFQVTENRGGAVPEGTDGSYAFQWAWIGPSTTETAVPLTATTSPVTIAGGVQPVVQNGRIFVGTQDGNVYGITLSTGANAWTRAVDGAVVTTCAVRQAIVMCVTTNGTVYGLNASTGAILWQTDLSYAVTASPLLTSTDQLIVATHGGTVVALSPFDGRIYWTASPSGGVAFESGIASDGIYVFALDEAMYAYKISLATGTSVATPVRLKGRSGQACHPVVAGGIVWFTTFMTHSQGSEYIAENLFSSSADLAAEETNIASFLAGTSGFADNSVDWQHRHAVTISSWTVPFTPLVMPSEGTGHPPPSMVVDNSGRVLVPGKTRYPSLIGNNGSTFGTAYTIDIFALNQSTGARITLGGGTRNSFPWETDNLYALSVAGGELWMNSRFRGTSALRSYASSSTRTMVRSYVAVEDGSNNCPAVFPICYVGSGTPRLQVSQATSPTVHSDFVWWNAPVLVGGKIILTENFGVTVIQ